MQTTGGRCRGGAAVALAVISLGAALVLWATDQAAAGTYRLLAPDGTMHFTNAPTSPAYRRAGAVSATAARWLNLPEIGSRYSAEITEAAARHGVPQRLVEAVIRVESAFNPWAISRTGARGLMQLMPGTAALLGVRDAFDPRQNIEGGVRHLRNLMDLYPNNLRLALAAYNAGVQAVSWYRGVPPYPETQQYVEKVLGHYGSGDGVVLLPADFYRYEGPDGTVTYTNIPQRRAPVRAGP